MPLKIVEPISTLSTHDLFGKIASRAKHLKDGRMTEEALLVMIYDAAQIYNVNSDFFKKCLDAKQKKQFKLNDEFFKRIKHMFQTNTRPMFRKISNALDLRYFNPSFSYRHNVRFITEADNTLHIREYVLKYQPTLVAVDAESCAFMKSITNRFHDYIAFAFSKDHIFIWYRPKKRFLKGLFKVLNDRQVCVLHWGPGDEKAFVNKQQSKDLQPLLPNGSMLSLTDAAKIVTGRPLDKGLTMGWWSAPPKELYYNYIEYFDYLIMDVLILFVIKEKFHIIKNHYFI
uniref:Uncharacterized protein n=1 Tax=Panagrolaimus sp. PS1159 TaxID=55785 RepID=A0AC35GQN6_9BILA